MLYYTFSETKCNQFRHFEYILVSDERSQQWLNLKEKIEYIFRFDVDARKGQKLNNVHFKSKFLMSVEGSLIGLKEKDIDRSFVMFSPNLFHQLQVENQI